MTYQTNLFYGASPLIIARAKALRQRMTPAEIELWKELQNKQMLGLKFRRQHPIDIFIADFYCHIIKLVIELYGEIHNKSNQKEYDINRTAELNRLGIEVIRFTNKEVLEEKERVVDAVGYFGRTVPAISV